ncbi:glutaminase domain-containing protein [Haladaptatus sp. DFWS20]|uniref:glutaminase family protein n=1 Tax=Haladaptatus sp. DFWS20 TaxID=3403467 RepID=UPI003EC02DDD
MSSLRPPAVPLVTHHPYFSVWSPTEHLGESTTTHWTGAENGLVGFAVIDGHPYRFAGEHGEIPTMDQTELTVQPTTTFYSFRAGGVELEVEFISPLLLDDFEILARPATYVSFYTSSIDNQNHDISIYFDITGEWCVDDRKQAIESNRISIPDVGQALQIGTTTQEILTHSGDDKRIDWGHLYLLPPCELATEMIVSTTDIRDTFASTGQLSQSDSLTLPTEVGDAPPVLACVFDMDVVPTSKQETFLTIAYDERKAIEYFEDHLQPYWRRNGRTVTEMLTSAVVDYPTLRERCAEFDSVLRQRCRSAGGESYADITALAYRQAIAAHTLVEYDDTPLFFSKECFSNGCIATVDVTYPSIPLFLLYAPDLVKGMLRPIFRYARTDDWPYEFAPHDVGTYPIANGQTYRTVDGELVLENQMPIEECGNVLIITAAICLRDGCSAFADENWELLTQWAEYLVENGFDPGEQLCTDDFAGHLAHNANLSLKAIFGIASYGILCGLRGDEDRQEKYLTLANQMAEDWTHDADDGEHFRLTFDRPGTWSLKYNLVWNNLFDLNLFDDDVAQREVVKYLEEQNKYGTPLDNRETYTKADWLLWAATLADDESDFEQLIDPLWRFLDESHDRVPFADWYDTETAERNRFQHRSVVGGLFLKLLRQEKHLLNSQ